MATKYEQGKESMVVFTSSRGLPLITYIHALVQDSDLNAVFNNDKDSSKKTILAALNVFGTVLKLKNVSACKIEAVDVFPYLNLLRGFISADEYPEQSRLIGEFIHTLQAVSAVQPVIVTVSPAHDIGEIGYFLCEKSDAERIFEVMAEMGIELIERDQPEQCRE